MKQQLVTAIDFYLQTEKVNPFVIHIAGNASSRQLNQLRNNSYILNKLSLLNLENVQSNGSQTFEEQYLNLYSSTLEAIINNPYMPYKDYQSIKDLIHKIQIYYSLLERLTFYNEGNLEKSQKLRKKLVTNTFWPRIRALMIAIQQKIPNSHAHIRQYVTIRRGLLETDKKYFVAQMMAKKIYTQELEFLVNKYKKEQQVEDEL